jgi:prepilin-type N-terminal cleavage/methylation domain-containing protein
VFAPASIRTYREELMQRTQIRKAFTLVEVLVGLIVTSILLSAVATLAFVLSSAVRASDDMAHTQTQLRTAAPRILDLVRYGRLICGQFDNHLVIWRADANGNDRIDVNEVVYLEYADPNLYLWEFPLDSNDNTDVLTALELPGESDVLAELAKAQTKTALIAKYSGYDPPRVRRSAILRGCPEATFTLDAVPPRTNRVVLSFLLADNDGDRRYEIEATMRVSARHLLSGDPPTLVFDDD